MISAAFPQERARAKVPKMSKKFPRRDALTHRANSVGWRNVADNIFFTCFSIKGVRVWSDAELVRVIARHTTPRPERSVATSTGALFVRRSSPMTGLACPPASEAINSAEALIELLIQFAGLPGGSKLGKQQKKRFDYGEQDQTINQLDSRAGMLVSMATRESIP
jgi:hypothetical protein